MSAKASVLNKYPQAMAWQWADGWIIYSKPAGGEYLCPTQKTRKAAWESAAKRLNLVPADHPLVATPEGDRGPRDSTSGIEQQETSTVDGGAES